MEQKTDCGHHEERKQSRWGFRGKTVWDWLQLLGVLAIPVVITVGGWMFNAQQNTRQQEIEEQRTLDATLQGYLDQMSTLVLENLSDPKVRTLARARTLTVLERLDASRKEQVMRFLVEAGLVQEEDLLAGNPIISLSGADRRFVLGDAEPSGGGLHGADLSDADLSRLDLSGAELSDANLSSAELRSTSLANADLRNANLEGALLPGAYLNTTHASDADLSDASLKDAQLPNVELFNADLSNANLEGALLWDAGLGGADLSNANLSDADLKGAYLKGANLHNANLRNANLNNVELRGATMPNGQEYEDWLKSKDSKEDG